MTSLYETHSVYRPCRRLQTILLHFKNSSLSFWQFCFIKLNTKCADDRNKELSV